jgi:hypothetical protein
MNPKFALLVIVASILIMAVYISSINSVSALITVRRTWSCVMGAGSTYASCNLTVKGDPDGNTSTNYNCNYDTKTEKWTCVKARTSSGTPNQLPGSDTLSKMTDSQIPPGLKSALDSAIKTQNSDLAIGGNKTQGTNSSQSTTINNSPKTQSQQQIQPTQPSQSK